MESKNMGLGLMPANPEEVAASSL